MDMDLFRSSKGGIEMLISTREINQACQDAATRQGRQYVFASTAQFPKIRIIRAKTFSGIQKVLMLNSGNWVVPTKVWVQ
jgi:hypothetical protein